MNFFYLTMKDRKEIDLLTKNNINQYKTIIKYTKLDGLPEQDYLSLVSRLIYFNDVCVGGYSFKHSDSRIIIKMFCILPKYQNLSLGTMLFQNILEYCKEMTPTVMEKRPTEIVTPPYEWFKKFGFKEQDNMLVLPL